MKFFKLILIIVMCVSITSCGDDSSEPTFILSNTNIAGTYNINSLSIDTKVTSVTEVAGVDVPFTVATSTSKGDTFQVVFVLSTNNTYTASGQYRIVSTITPTVGNPVSNNEIINFNESGSYQLNTTNNTITFNSAAGDFLEGTLKIITFNETMITFNQEIEEVVDLITTEIDATISFTRQ